MNNRSNLAIVRNPILKLEAINGLKKLPPDVRSEIVNLLMELRVDCQANSEKCWKKHKAPMAAYWKAASVYIGHISRALR